ncbi:MAG: hypothetical protein LBL45_12200 [Treponema sp.]|jgi:hypothetical protein|nr:hypothetical protein [Treponema sp.]
MSRIKRIACILGKNALLYAVYLAVTVFFITRIYSENYIGAFQYVAGAFRDFLNAEPPVTFLAILSTSIIFIFFTLIASAAAAKREQNYFTTAFVLRLSLFLMNIIPIAIFQHALFPRFGFALIYFFIIYLVFEYVGDIVRTRVPIKSSGALSFIIRFGTEAMTMALALLVAYLITPERYKHIEMRSIDLRIISEHIAYILYIVAFNSVSFFTVEYGIAVVSMEYKKNHAKYFCRFNDGLFERFIYLLRSAAPQILEKIRKNLSWLVSFIITVEAIFEFIPSVGVNLLNGYSQMDAIIIIKSGVHLLSVMLIINIIIDIALSFLQGKESALHKNEGGSEKRRLDKRDFPSAEHDSQDGVKIAMPVKAILKKYYKSIMIGTISFMAFIALGAFCYYNYPIAGYYDFERNKNKTVNDFIVKRGIKTEGLDEAALNTPLCQNAGNGFLIAKIELSDRNGVNYTIIPFYDIGGTTFHFIQGNVNKQGSGIAKTDVVTNIGVMKKCILFPEVATAFRLPAGTSRNFFGTKPLFLILPFYAFYFILLLLVVGAVTFVLYAGVVKRRILKENGCGVSRWRTAANGVLANIVKYLNALSLIVVFILVNFFIQTRFNTQWENYSFILNMTSYIIIQLLIVCMFSATFLQEMRLHIENIAASQEFKYYRIIGMNAAEQRAVYNKKYGKIFFYKIYIQNILFALNINWFISYAFNVWRTFRDSIGLTYSISFENIFTKIVHLKSVKSDWFNYVIIVAMYGSLFAFYYFIHRDARGSGRRVAWRMALGKKKNKRDC